MNYNFSYKQLQEICKDKDEEIERLRTIINDILSVSAKYIGFPNDTTFVIIGDNKISMKVR